MYQLLHYKTIYIYIFKAIILMISSTLSIVIPTAAYIEFYAMYWKVNFYHILPSTHLLGHISYFVTEIRLYTDGQTIKVEGCEENHSIHF